MGIVRHRVLALGRAFMNKGDEPRRKKETSLHNNTADEHGETQGSETAGSIGGCLADRSKSSNIRKILYII